MLTAFIWLIDVGEAVDVRLAELHTWGPLLAVLAGAVAAGAGARSDAVRTRIRTASGRLPARLCSLPLNCPDTYLDGSADARPDVSGHGSGGGS
ncbi:hypothetical protein GTY54_22395 [Streptomyces sp. SID625]|nr:hypothetical protein [Streptomyces sp. SID625]